MESANTFDMHSLEEGRHHPDNQSDVVSGRSQRTSRSKQPQRRRRTTVASTSARQRANSSFQYPSNMSVFSTGASTQSQSMAGNAKSPVQEIPSSYHYEIVPTTFPFSHDSDNSTEATPNPSSAENMQSSAGIPNTINNGSKVMVRPKQIQQNPLTPTILPKGFTPINKWGRLKAKYHKEWMAEFLGTFVLVALGDACSLQNLLNMKSNEEKYTKFLASVVSSSKTESDVSELLSAVTMITQGYSINVQLGWGGAVLCGYFAAGGSSLSGAHLNMCVTLSFFLFRGSPHWKLVLPYIFAQLFGGYVAGLLLFGYYRKVIEVVFPDWKHNQQLFSAFVTVPLDYLSSGRQFLSEAVASMFLIMGIFAMTDPYSNTSNDLFPLYMFILIYTLMAAMSLQTEAAINFGRDLGPRFALWTVGASGDLLFSSNKHYFWVPIVGPVVGGLWGAFLYDIFIFRGHESWVNRPVYQNVDSLRRKWYKFKRLFTKHLKSSYNSDDYSDYDDDSYITDSDTEIGDSHNSGDGSELNVNSDKEHGDLSDDGVGYDRLSLNGLDTYSLNDIPEEDVDELDNKLSQGMLKNGQPRSILYASGTFEQNNQAKASNKGTRPVNKRDIHFKSNGKNRRFVPTL